MLTTVNAIVQRVPAREIVAAQALSVAPGHVVPMDSIVAWLEHNGYNRSSTVREPGEYAVRGGILDLFPAGLDQPVRFDFFGDSLESIRTFDAETQRTLLDMRSLDLVPISEFQLVTETIRRFRMGYVAAFGAPERDDPLYEAVSEGRRHPGMEHWLPLFQERMDTLFDYLDGAPVAIEPQSEDAARERFKQIADYYEARREALEHPGGGAIYKPLPPDRLYLTEDEWTKRLERGRAGAADAVRGARGQRRRVRCRRAAGPQFCAGARRHLRQRVRSPSSPMCRRCRPAQEGGDRAVERGLARPHGQHAARPQAAQPHQRQHLAHGAGDAAQRGHAGGASAWNPASRPTMSPSSASRTFWATAWCGRARRAASSTISSRRSRASPAGDLVVHVEHGIGRFVGLQTLEVAGAPHDCLELHYAAETKLFLPVENIELLSRYGSDHANVELDRLGGSGWQARKAKLKNRIREIAGELIKIAAERHLHEAPKLPVQPHVYDEFCARFPYEETEDQLGAINATLKDLESGRPMDRLICGDVGFGKTEVALRAAFAVALDGKQVAVVVPTTLLARQHSKTFAERFRGFPGQCRAGLAPGRAEGTDAGQEGARRRLRRYRGRHPCAARQVDQVQGSRPA